MMRTDEGYFFIMLAVTSTVCKHWKSPLHLDEPSKW